MSETPTYPVYEHQVQLTDSQIENRQETPLTVEEHFERWEQQMATPPTYLMPEQNHEVVAPVHQEVVAEKTSVVEVHNAMTQEAKVAYVGAITPIIPKVRSDYARIA